jgi:hypothetical protein
MKVTEKQAAAMYIAILGLLKFDGAPDYRESLEELIADIDESEGKGRGKS